MQINKINIFIIKIKTNNNTNFYKLILFFKLIPMKS